MRRPFGLSLRGKLLPLGLLILPMSGRAGERTIDEWQRPLALQRRPATPTLGGMPFSFIENRGQWDQRARFPVLGPEMSVVFTPSAFAIELAGRQDRSTASSDSIAHAGVFLTFEGADEGVVLEGVDPLPGRYNYFIGRDPSQWHTGV